MNQKPKFKPVVTRIKLNPEQAVLQCPCWDRGSAISTTGRRANTLYCLPNTRTKPDYLKATTSTALS